MCDLSICFIWGFAPNHTYGTHKLSHSLSNDVDYVKGVILLNDTTPNTNIHQIQPFLLVVSCHPSNDTSKLICYMLLSSKKTKQKLVCMCATSDTTTLAQL